MATFLSDGDARQLKRLTRSLIDAEKAAEWAGAKEPSERIKIKNDLAKARTAWFAWVAAHTEREMNHGAV